jgi:hypothetical protein
MNTFRGRILRKRVNSVQCLHIYDIFISLHVFLRSRDLASSALFIRFIYYTLDINTSVKNELDRAFDSVYQKWKQSVRVVFVFPIFQQQRCNRW